MNLHRIKSTFADWNDAMYHFVEDCGSQVFNGNPDDIIHEIYFPKEDVLLKVRYHIPHGATETLMSDKTGILDMNNILDPSKFNQADLNLSIISKNGPPYDWGNVSEQIFEYLARKYAKTYYVDAP